MYSSYYCRHSLFPIIQHRINILCDQHTQYIKIAIDVFMTSDLAQLEEILEDNFITSKPIPPQVCTLFNIKIYVYYVTSRVFLVLC